MICYPTETFYALGIDPWNQMARENLIALKGRPQEKELPMIASEISMVARFCDIEDLRFHQLAKKFWPGPLTLVLPSRDHSRSYAIRVSSHPVARQIASALEKPVVSTSANFSGQPSVSTPADIPRIFQEQIIFLIDAGVCPGGLPSTILTLLERPGRVLREGSIPSEQLLGGL